MVLLRWWYWFWYIAFGGRTSCVKCSSSSGGVRPRPQMGQPYSPASRAPDILVINNVDFDGNFMMKMMRMLNPSSPRYRIWNLSIPILESSSFEFDSDFSLTSSSSRVMLTDRPSFNSDSTWIRKTALPLAPYLSFHLLISSSLLTWDGNTLGPSHGSVDFLFLLELDQGPFDLDIFVSKARSLDCKSF